jgi:hypothetical protein
MPYNTAPIPPSEEATGTTNLPCKSYPNIQCAREQEFTHDLVARVKRVLAQDDEIQATSNLAAFEIAKATVC